MSVFPGSTKANLTRVVNNRLPHETMLFGYYDNTGLLAMFYSDFQNSNKLST